MVRMNKATVILSTILATGAIVTGCSSNKPATQAQPAAVKVDPSLVTRQEAMTFASHSRSDTASVSKDKDLSVWVSYEQCGNSVTHCEISTGMVFGMGLNTQLTGKESPSEAIAVRRRIRKESQVKDAFADLVQGQKRDMIMPLVTRAWTLSYKSPTQGGINAEDPIDSALFVVVTLSGAKVDNGGSFDGMHTESVDKYAGSTEFAKVYQEISNSNDKISALQSHVASVENRLQKAIDDEREARVAAISAEATARVNGIAAESEARVAAVAAEAAKRQEQYEALQASLRREADLRSQADHELKNYSDWSARKSTLEHEIKIAGEQLESFETSLKVAQTEYDAAQVKVDKISPSWTLLTKAERLRRELNEASTKLSNATYSRDQAQGVLNSFKTQLAQMEQNKPSVTSEK